MPQNRWRTKTDRKGNVTLSDGHHSNVDPVRVVEGWIDDGTTAGQFDAGDDDARRRDTAWHPRLRAPIAVTGTLALAAVLETLVYDELDRLTEIQPLRTAGYTAPSRTTRAAT